ncbi:hypothetical protein G9F31_05135 [Acinetobacter sp. 187]|uniref:RcnB family protein n=1 Tax=Acinetobacter lanii TaxID=2715163 RepID=UPI00140D2600|nr:RcnB family protein [Acinetobacter lanii]NHC03154.1 hypothetical protein [Acinetobacter lanii]
MKKILSAIALSMSAILSASAIAAPNDHRDHRYDSRDKAHWNDQDRRNQNNGRFDRNDRDNRYNRAVNPSRDWRTGQTLPRQYSSSRYQVSNSTLKRLPKANRNQQWYKINGDYVLVNERNDKIVKIIN